jgi:hypothetical protein
MRRGLRNDDTAFGLAIDDSHEAMTMSVDKISLPAEETSKYWVGTTLDSLRITPLFQVKRRVRGKLVVTLAFYI